MQAARIQPHNTRVPLYRTGECHSEAVNVSPKNRERVCTSAPSNARPHNMGRARRELRAVREYQLRIRYAGGQNVLASRVAFAQGRDRRAVRPTVPPFETEA